MCRNDEKNEKIKSLNNKLYYQKNLRLKLTEVIDSLKNEMNISDEVASALKVISTIKFYFFYYI